MKINVEIGIEEVFDLDSEEEVKEELQDRIEKDLKDYAKRNLLYAMYDGDSFKELLKELIEEHKKEIIESVIDRVSKSIIKTKRINDFKKELEDE